MVIARYFCVARTVFSLTVAAAVSVANGDTIILGDAARQDWRGQPVMTSLAEPDSNAWRKASCVEYARQMGFDRRRGLERIGEQDSRYLENAAIQASSYKRFKSLTWSSCKKTKR